MKIMVLSARSDRHASVIDVRPSVDALVRALDSKVKLMGGVLGKHAGAVVQHGSLLIQNVDRLVGMNGKPLKGWSARQFFEGIFDLAHATAEELEKGSKICRTRSIRLRHAKTEIYRGRIDKRNRREYLVENRKREV